MYGELGTVLDDKLASWNLSKLTQQVGRKPKNTTGINVVGTAEEESSVPPPPVANMNALSANIERMITAAVAGGRTPARSPAGSRAGSAGSQRGGNNRRIPNPRFEGCWCCGEKGQSRQQCSKFKAIKDANGGKFPQGYEGAYEKAMKKTQASRTTNLKAISAAPTIEPPLMDYEETLKLWPVLKMPPPVKVSNKFSPLTDNTPDTEDEADMVRALCVLTPNIHKASDKSKSQKSKRSRGARPLNLSHLNAIARKVKSGEISMPEVDLEHNDQFDYVWAMVDSGAGANVARKEHFPSSKRVSAPKISPTVANGEVLPNQRARAVECHDRYGSHRSRMFYEAPVKMPICIGHQARSRM